MENGIYHDISTRTGGDIYIGVVGPVRTGKSTFIKRFMETMVLPGMENMYKRELGGGIRSMQDVETVLALGVSRVIIGSAAVRHPEFVAEAVKKYGDKIVVGIDAKSETVRTDGWLDDSGENYIAFAERMESYGVKNIIFTDIDKDGMLAGPNFDQLAALRASVSCEIIASGGVSTLEDIAALKKLGIDGAIAGKAVYTGTLDLAKAIKEAE